jgi:hypothetical protein
MRLNLQRKAKKRVMRRERLSNTIENMAFLGTISRYLPISLPKTRFGCAACQSRKYKLRAT